MVLMKTVSKAMFTLILLSLLLACGKDKDGAVSKDDQPIPFKLKMRWKHDPQAWTQGLLIHDGKLFESTGQKQSYIGIVDIKTGKPDKKVILDDIITHKIPLEEAPHGYEIFNNKEDSCLKVILKP